jgi:hypothetical protein
MKEDAEEEYEEEDNSLNVAPSTFSLKMIR